MISPRSLFSRKSPEEKAAEEAAKTERKAAEKRANEERRAANQAKFDELMAPHRQEKEERRTKYWETFRGALVEGETVEAEFTTTETFAQKDLIFTNRRMLVKFKSSKDIESILYRSITSFRTQNFITRDLVLKVQDRRAGELELQFDNEETRDRALGIVTKRELGPDLGPTAA
jgi:hypothetical protein